ncbi:MAG: FAD-dependent oxidoreductase, partial [Woeseiaceae bacterium]
MKRRKFLQSSAAAGTVAFLGGCGEESILGVGNDERYTDAEDLEPGSLIVGDICIVGAGAAGISMALELAGSGLQVILLEAGGMRYEPDSQEQYRGENIGEPYFPLEAARLRYFGGTTGHWAGLCSPFDEIDFQVRDW